MEKPPSPDGLSVVEQVHTEADAALRTFHARFAEALATLEGRDFGSLEENRRIAQQIQDTADLIRVAFKCPKCSRPARIRCSRAATLKNGMFTFGHTSGTHGGTGTLPKLVLVEPAPDGRKAKETDSGADLPSS